MPRTLAAPPRSTPTDPPEPALALPWIAALKERAERAPQRPRVPLRLRVAGARRAPVSIGSIEPALAARLAGAGQPLHADAAQCWIDVARRDAVDTTLAELARGLSDLGLSRGWRDELVAVTSPTGARVGAIERSAVRALGITTRAVHLVVLDAQGSMWVQLRSRDKANDPGMWDTTVGGLISDGESAAQALTRETWEEAGLRAPDLRSLTAVGDVTVRRPMPEGYMVEHLEVFEAQLVSARTPSNQDGEVERFECWDLATLARQLQADAFTLEASVILVQWMAPLGLLSP
jgi:8-oxo-dGTP pyrophosphatase MutT (NUDIX family)